MFELQSSPQTDETVVTSDDGHGFSLEWPVDIGNAPLIGYNNNQFQTGSGYSTFKQTA